MKRKIGSVALGVLIGLLPMVCSSSTLAQQTSTPATSQTQGSGDTPESPNEEVHAPAKVVIDARPVLTVYEPLGTMSPQDRASGIEMRIIAIARDSHLKPEEINLVPRPSFTWIVAANETIMAVTDADAKMAGTSRPRLSAQYAESIRQAIRNYREEHSWRMITRGFLKTALATLVLVVVLWLIRRMRLTARDWIEKEVYRCAHLEKKSAWHLSVAYLGPITLAVGAIVRWVLILALFEAYLTVTLSFYSSTRGISSMVTSWVFSQLESLGRSVLDYLPNLLVLAVIALVTNYAVRLLRLVFGEVAKGELKIHGFYPDWAEPTEKLIRLLLFVLALIVAFPYLPGAKSPAFQGISIFLGVLLSLGSSSAVANAIAGVILTYMRSFLVGDWVQIGDTTGEVVEKNLLVTRVLTPKAEIITIPNAAVMSGSVKNYSVEARKSGVIFYTTVTIGYDAEWRTVHRLLTSAALATQHVLQEPAPFVLQKSLDDFYVAYELNAYTDCPREMLNIYSDLHQNIQDKFNEAGVEICSPHFSSLRDGNVIAIPEPYIKPDYKAPGFRFNGSETPNDGASQPAEVTSRPTRTG
jgi:small-conductance mechanosensitive channel